jgi:hypothetical protein
MDELETDTSKTEMLAHESPANESKSELGFIVELSFE